MCYALVYYAYSVEKSFVHIVEIRLAKTALRANTSLIWRCALDA